MPSQAPEGEGVETRRRPPVGRFSPWRRHSPGSPEMGTNPNPLVVGSSPTRPTTTPSETAPQRGAVERYAGQKTPAAGKLTGRDRSRLKLSVNTKTCLGEALSVPRIVASGCRTGRSTVRDRGSCLVLGKMPVPTAGPRRTVGPWRTAGKLLSGMAKPPSSPRCKPTAAAHASGYESSALTN
jgi:hypothetical protein